MNNLKMYTIKQKSNYSNSKLKKSIIKIVSGISALGIMLPVTNAVNTSLGIDLQQISYSINHGIENYVGQINNTMKTYFVNLANKTINKKLNEYLSNNQLERGIYEMKQILRDDSLDTAPGGALKIVVAGITAIKLKALLMFRRVIISTDIVLLSLPEMKREFLRILNFMDLKLPFNFNNERLFNH